MSVNFKCIKHLNKCCISVPVSFKQAILTFWTHSITLVQRIHFSAEQQYMAIATIEAVNTQAEVDAGPWVSSRVIIRLHQSHRDTGLVIDRPQRGRPSVTWSADELLEVTATARNGLVHVTQLQIHLREVKNMPLTTDYSQTPPLPWPAG